MSGSMEAAVLLDEAVRKLQAAPAIDHWQRGRERIEAEILLEHVVGDEVDPEDVVPPSRARRFRALIDRRASGEPVPFITGVVDFRGLELRARPGVFVPRDSSEFLAEQAVRRLRGRADPVHVDLATGGGTVALAVANEVPAVEVWGTDVSEDAVRLARANARSLELQARFVRGDLFGGLPRRLAGRVDVITLHPPYVARSEMRHLPDEIIDWEPAHTLTDRSRDGLGLLSRAVTEAPTWLRPRGWLLVEVSPDRSASAKRVYRAGGFTGVQSTKGGTLQVTRVIVGRRSA
jgi:release factor glutamine methyltransferase